MTNTPDEIKKGLEWDEVDESLRKIRFDDAGEVVEWKPKTSTDTKNGLLCCTIEGGCNDCPYQQDCFQTDGFSELAGDSLALIQRLQAENADQAVRIQQLEKRVIHLEALNQSDLTTITMQERTRARLQERIIQLESDKQQLEGMLAHMNQLRDAAAGRALEMEERVHQLEAERDAIMQDMNKNCTSCKHSGMNNPDNPCYKFEEQCRDYSNWQWRGVQKEE